MELRIAKRFADLQLPPGSVIGEPYWVDLAACSTEGSVITSLYLSRTEITLRGTATGYSNTLCAEVDECPE